MLFTYGTNWGSDNRGVLEAKNRVDALQRAIDLTNAHTVGRAKYYSSIDRGCVAQIECRDHPNYDQYYLGVNYYESELYENNPINNPVRKGIDLISTKICINCYKSGKTDCDHVKYNAYAN